MNIGVSTKTGSRLSHLGWLLLLPLAAIWVLIPGISPFVRMCCIAITMFVLIKTHVLFHYAQISRSPAVGDILAWYLAWPGLDARAFFCASGAASPGIREWVFAVAKTFGGLWLLFGMAPRLRDVNDLLCGWVALVGVVFVLHFGLFHIAALFWRWKGRNVRQLMNAPVLSRSVNEFWSERWNLAFRDYASPFIFLPLARMTSVSTALSAGYLFSGIIHEIVISVPASAGYGLPTLYFLIQAVGIMIERTAERSCLARTKHVWGWFWTAAITAPGAFFLFHPPFVRRVVLPFVDYLSVFS